MDFSWHSKNRDFITVQSSQSKITIGSTHLKKRGGKEKNHHRVVLPVQSHYWQYARAEIVVGAEAECDIDAECDCKGAAEDALSHKKKIKKSVPQYISYTLLYIKSLYRGLLRVGCLSYIYLLYIPIYKVTVQMTCESLLPWPAPCPACPGEKKNSQKSAPLVYPPYIVPMKSTL